MVTAEKKTEEAPVFLMSTVHAGSQTLNHSVYVVIRELGAIEV